MASLKHLVSGKVRDIFGFDDRHLLMVATDRISAYDCILTPEIPDKGKILTGLSEFWFAMVGVRNHMVTTNIADIGLDDQEIDSFSGRSMLIRRAEVLPMECVVRGYLYGSAWIEYNSGGGPTTEHLHSGLQQADQLEQPIFTPATKAATGHDRNLDETDAREMVGDDVYDQVRSISIDAYLRASGHAAARGLILADTKFEFGWVDGELAMIDEALTPDSSRYWPVDRWTPGGAVPSFDKQFVRDWLDSIGFDRVPPAPELPDDIVLGTRSRYVEAYERITDNSFEQYLEDHGA